MPTVYTTSPWARLLGINFHTPRDTDRFQACSRRVYLWSMLLAFTSCLAMKSYFILKAPCNQKESLFKTGCTRCLCLFSLGKSQVLKQMSPFLRRRVYTLDAAAGVNARALCWGGGCVCSVHGWGCIGDGEGYVGVSEAYVHVQNIRKNCGIAALKKMWSCKGWLLQKLRLRKKFRTVYFRIIIQRKIAECDRGNVALKLRDCDCVE